MPVSKARCHLVQVLFLLVVLLNYLYPGPKWD